MNQLKFLSKLAITSIASAGVFIFPMKAEALKPIFIIDDFGPRPGVGPTSSCQDVTASAIPDPSCDNLVNANPTVIPTDNTVMHSRVAVPNGTVTMNGWSRSLSADLIFGDSVTTEVCTNCGVGELDIDVNSYGWGDWTYNGPSLDLSWYDRLMFDWGADQAGADIRFIFERQGVGSFMLQQNDLPQGQPFTPSTFMLDLPDDPNSINILEDITSIEILIDGSGREFDRTFDINNPGQNDPNAIFDLDANIDNIKLVKAPEPGTILGLVSISVLSLSLKRKKQS